MSLHKGSMNLKITGLKVDVGGEGSRGGKIVGHTSGGKPIYAGKRRVHIRKSKGTFHTQLQEHTGEHWTPISSAESSTEDHARKMVENAKQYNPSAPVVGHPKFQDVTLPDWHGKIPPEKNKVRDA